MDVSSEDGTSKDFAKGLAFSLAINVMFTLGVMLVFYTNNVPLWLWLLYAIKQLMGVLIYVIAIKAFRNENGNKAAGVVGIVSVVTVQVVLKTIVTYYASIYTNIPAWTWTFSSMASISIVILAVVDTYQNKQAKEDSQCLPVSNIAVRSAIIMTLAIYLISTASIAFYGLQLPALILFGLSMLLQLLYGLRDYFDLSSLL